MRVTADRFAETKAETAFVGPMGNLVAEARKRALCLKGKTGPDRLPRVSFLLSDR